jgi:hypothetical protein
LPFGTGGLGMRTRWADESGGVGLCPVLVPWSLKLDTIAWR